MDASFKCSRCKQLKPAGDFHSGNPSRTRPVSAYCKVCKARHRQDNKDKYSARERAYAVKHRDKKREYDLQYKRTDRYKQTAKIRYLQKNYGLSLAAYEALCKSQDYKCAICRADGLTLNRDWHVDHCHKTGKVRGLLCFSCNTGIGKLRDSVELLSSAIEYLKRGAA